MKKEYLYGILGLIGGGLLTLVLTTSAVNSNNTRMMEMMGMHASVSQSDTKSDDANKNGHMMPDGSMMSSSMMNDDQSMTMNGMVDSLKGKTGDDFDKLFISEMIDHHQGAIDMAKLAEKNAKHDEIKTLSNDIISAQTKEIDEMKSWQSTWGY